MPNPVDKEQLKRWRLILGQHSQEPLARMGGAGGCDLSEEQAGKLVEAKLQSERAVALAQANKSIDIGVFKKNLERINGRLNKQ